MAREMKSSTEIQAEMSRLIQAEPDVAISGDRVIVPLPRLLSPPDASGCNWTIGAMRGAASTYPDAVARCIREIQSRWNLRN